MVDIAAALNVLSEKMVRNMMMRSSHIITPILHDNCYTMERIRRQYSNMTNSVYV